MSICNLFSLINNHQDVTQYQTIASLPDEAIFMDIEQAKRFHTHKGNVFVIQLLNEAPKDAVYYVDEHSEHTNTQGFYTDKFVVGVHKKHTHYKLSDLKSAVMWEK